MFEADFTPPNSWCPDPGFWHADDGDATEHEVTELVAAFVRALQPELVVETGSYSAQTSLAVGEALARNGHGRLVTLEIEPELAGIAKAKCAGLPVTIPAATMPAVTRDHARRDRARRFQSGVSTPSRGTSSPGRAGP